MPDKDSDPQVQDHSVSSSIRRAFLAGALAKVAAVGCQIATLAVVARSVPPGEFALLAVFIGTMGLFDFLDLGIGNSLIARVSNGLALGRTSDIRRDVGSALVALLGMASILITLVLALLFFLPTAYLPDTGSDSSVVQLHLTVFLISLAVSLPMSLGNKLALGLGRGPMNSAVLFIASAISLAVTAAASLTEQPSIAFTVAIVSVPFLINGVQTVILLASPTFRGWSRAATWAGVRSIAVAGAPFMAFGLSAVVNYQTQSAVVAYALGPTAVAAFGVAARMFNFALTLFTAGLQQYWGLIARLLALGQLSTVRRTLIRVTAVVVASSLVLCAGLCLLGQQIVVLWVGDRYRPELALLLALAAWTVYRLSIMPFSFLLNAGQSVWPQALANVLMAAVNLPLMMLATARFGYHAPPLTSLMTHMMLVAPVLAYGSLRILNGRSLGVANRDGTPDPRSG